MNFMSWPISSFRFFCKMVWENVNELFGQLNIYKTKLESQK